MPRCRPRINLARRNHFEAISLAKKAKKISEKDNDKAGWLGARLGGECYVRQKQPWMRMVLAAGGLKPALRVQYLGHFSL